MATGSGAMWVLLGLMSLLLLVHVVTRHDAPVSAALHFPVHMGVSAPTGNTAKAATAATVEAAAAAAAARVSKVHAKTTPLQGAQAKDYAAAASSRATDKVDPPQLPQISPALSPATADAPRWQSSWRSEEWRKPCAPLLARLTAIEDLARSDPSASRPVVWHCGCATGVGDRWRGIRRAALMATTYGRPFALETTPEINFTATEAGVMPRSELVDWRRRFAETMPVIRELQARLPGEVWEEHDGKGPRVSLGTLLGRAGSQQHYILTKSYPDPGSAEATALKNIFGVDPSPSNHHLPSFCMTRALLVPTPPMIDMLESLHLEQDDQPGEHFFHLNPFLVGVHVRFGRIKGDWGQQRADDEDATSILSCAWNMTMSWLQTGTSPRMLGLDTEPLDAVRWLLASDDPLRLRNMTEAFVMARGHVLAPHHHLQTVYVNQGIVRHITATSTRHHDAKDVFTRIWLDLLLLAESHTCVFARSGFPRLGCGLSARLALNAGRENEWMPVNDPVKHLRGSNAQFLCDSWTWKTGKGDGLRG